MDKKIYILYVEDDLTVANSVERILRLKNDILDLDVVNNSEDAIEYFHKKHYDIIISDIRLPKVNGLEAIKNMKKENSEIYTVITSAFNEKEYLHEAIKTKIDKYLLKPIDLKELIETIEKYYEQKNLKEKMKLQEDMLHLQSKMAMVGEMTDAVAHQWKQPLSSMALAMAWIELQEIYTEEIFEKCRDKINKQISHMVSTLDEFRSFMRPDKNRCHFGAKKCWEHTFTLIDHEMMHNKITINLDLENDFDIYGIENQFIHILLNLISNSKDAFRDNDIQNRTINISLQSDQNSNKIVYQDNAGGVPKDVIDKIFELNFTTKEDGKGTGVGLYLSNQIAHNHNATINVENIDDGSRFIIDIAKV